MDSRNKEAPAPSPSWAACMWRHRRLRLTLHAQHTGGATRALTFMNGTKEEAPGAWMLMPPLRSNKDSKCASWEATLAAC